MKCDEMQRKEEKAQHRVHLICFDPPRELPCLSLLFPTNISPDHAAGEGELQPLHTGMYCN